MASKVCENAGCAGNGIKVDTDAENCIMCGRPLRSALFAGGGLGGLFGDIFSTPPEPDFVDAELRDAVNAALHRSVNIVDACQTACTHRIHREWTALGIANVVARHAKP